MSDRFDVLKSLVRGAADRAGSRLRGLGPVARMRKLLKDAAHQRAIVTEEDLTRAIAHAHGVRAASVQVRDGGIRVDVGFEDGSRYAATLVPAGARFAPRGAKEVLFRIEPPERARGRHAMEVVSAVAGAVARSLWNALLGPDEGQLQGGIVDRDSDVLRVDLRTVPAVRKLAGRGATAMIIDVIRIGAVRAENGELSLELKMPEIMV